MSSEFAQIQKNVTALNADIMRARAFDLQEIRMAAAAASSLLVPAVGAMMTSLLIPRVLMAEAQARVAHGRINAVVHWLSKSADSPSRLSTSKASWKHLSDMATALGERMVEVQRRGMNNEWSGEAKDRWTAFTTDQIQRHEDFQHAVGTMPNQMTVALHVTQGLLVHVWAMTARTQCITGPISLIPPNPSPVNFAIAQRSSRVATALETLAGQLEQLQAGGVWKVQMHSLSHLMRRTGDVIGTTGRRKPAL